MNVTREVAGNEWKVFLPAFSERNLGRPVRLETTVPAGEGEPVLAEHRPLLAVDVDLKGSDAPGIEVTLGGLDVETPNFTHVITAPTKLWVAEELDGLGIALAIESLNEGRTVLIFEPEGSLPKPSS